MQDELIKGDFLLKKTVLTTKPFNKLITAIAEL